MPGKKRKNKRKRKEKIKNEKDILSDVGMSVRMGRVEALACGRADGRAEVDNCKEKKKARKGKQKGKLTGLGMWTCYRWACVRLQADVDGCKQTNKKGGNKKGMEWTYRRWWA